MNGIQFQQALRGGELVLGTAVVSASPLWPKMIQRSGVDFVFIDTEHIPQNRETLAWMCQCYRALDVMPLVRISSADPHEANQVLDSGAGGVVVPYVEATAQVLELIGAVKYRPLKGFLLEDLVFDGASVEPKLKEYLEVRNRGSSLIINIESRPALDQLESLLAFPELDGVLVGPHDLSCSLGVPEEYDHPEFLKAVRKIFELARRAGKGAGIHFWGGLDKEKLWIEEGANYLIHSTDVLLVEEVLRRDLAGLRGGGHKGLQGGEGMMVV